jgi:hypothetical protein
LRVYMLITVTRWRNLIMYMNIIVSTVSSPRSRKFSLSLYLSPLPPSHPPPPRFLRTTCLVLGARVCLSLFSSMVSMNSRDVAVERVGRHVHRLLLCLRDVHSMSPSWPPRRRQRSPAARSPWSRARPPTTSSWTTGTRWPRRGPPPSAPSWPAVRPRSR